jgi:hypothetical protein
VFAEPKVRSRAKASSRGGVWRKPYPKMQGDVQEPDLRCGIDLHILNFTALSVVGVLQYSLLPLAF